MNEGEILLRQLRAHFHLAAFGQAEQRARARADDLADLDVAREDQPGGRRDDVEPADLGAGRPRAAPGQREPAHRRRRGAFFESISALETKPRPWSASARSIIRLGKRGIGARRFDLRGELRRLLRLDRAVDDREQLAGADPAAGVDEHADDPAARSGDADRLVALGGKRAAGGDHAADLAVAGDDHGDGRDLARRRPPPPARLVRCAAPIDDENKDDQQRTATAAAMMTSRRRARERSTTTSVSEEWIEVSRFIIPCPISRI